MGNDMKRLLSCIAVLLLLSEVHSVAALEHFTLGRIEGNASISVDGDFADWDGISVIPLPISYVNSLSQPGLPKSANDVSASFRCLADNDNIYIAVNVADDALIFGEESMGIPFLDDCVEVLFYSSQTSLQPAKIWISGDRNGGVKLEGREPQNNKSYPFLWENQGVRAELKKSDAGYRVELLVPKNVLSLVGWRSGDVLRMNVVVYDDDNGGSFESIMQWADPNISPGCNEIGFDELLVSPNAAAESQVFTQEIEIAISSPDQPEEPVDPVVQYDLGVSFERAGMYTEAIAEFQKGIAVVTEGELKNKIHLALARNYFYTEEFDKAKPICEALLQVDTDNQRVLDANMLLLSMDRKQSGFMDQ